MRILGLKGLISMALYGLWITSTCFVNIVLCLIRVTLVRLAPEGILEGTANGYEFCTSHVFMSFTFI